MATALHLLLALLLGPAAGPALVDPPPAATRPDDAPAAQAVLRLLDEGAAAAASLEAELLPACQRGDGDACAARSLALQLLRRWDEAEEAARLAVVAGAPAGRWAQGRAALARHAEWGPARNAFDEACRAGHLPACHDLAGVLQSGPADHTQPAAALALQVRTCRAGFGPSCHALALRYRAGGDVARSRLLAAFMEGRACRLGHGQACRAIGPPLAREARAFPPLARWLEGLERPGVALLCDRGRAWACARLAGLLAADPATAGEAQVRIEALERRACDGGELAGCAALGARLLARPGQVSAGLPLLERACAGGQAEACALAAGAMQAEAPARAVALRRQACRGGHAAACLELAWAQAEGRLPGVDDAEAAGFLEAACERADPTACASLGSWLARGRGRPRDARRALEVLQRACEIGPGVYTTAGCVELATLREAACEAGSPRACVRLGRMIQAGLGLDMDDARSAALFERACQAGEAVGCYELGLLRVREASAAPPASPRARRAPGPAAAPPDLAPGVALLERACSGLVPAACLELWRLTEAGRIPRAGPEASRRRLQLACDVRAWPACEALGDGLKAGAPVRAAGLYQSACRGGEPSACRKLAMLLLAGAGGASLDPRLPLELLGDACERGDAEACCGLAAALGRSDPDLPEELRAGVVQLACDGGAAACCTLLGQLHLEGRGVPVDRARARARFHEGCLLGDPEGCAQRDGPRPPAPPRRGR